MYIRRNEEYPHQQRHFLSGIMPSFTKVHCPIMLFLAFKFCLQIMRAGFSAYLILRMQKNYNDNGEHRKPYWIQLSAAVCKKFNILICLKTLYALALYILFSRLKFLKQSAIIGKKNTAYKKRRIENGCRDRI